MTRSRLHPAPVNVRTIALVVMTLTLTGIIELHPEEAVRPGTEHTSGPTVGLALAGGGALGFAHLGVILFLEEIGLDPQYVSGTSIGSIVGALYAAGYTGEEMLDIVQSADWGEILFDVPIRTSLAVDAREATRRYRLTARFDRWNLVTPTGFSAGQRVTEFLDALLSSHAGTDDFHTLPRPIGIVATDLLRGTEVVFTSGDLKSAVRASIAVPGILTPLRYDGRYLIDGGWTNNLPVDVVKDLGADIVIAVDLFESDRSIDELQDVGAIVEQAGIILRQQRIRENRELADIVIVPDLRGYTTVDFDRAMELVERGRSAAEAQREQLIALRDRVIAERENDGRASGPALTRPPSPDPDRSFHIGAVHLDVPPDRDTPDALKEFYLSFLGNTYTARELRSAVYALYDGGGYEYVSYDLEAETNAYTDETYHRLTVYAVPEKRHSSELQLGFGSRINLDGEMNSRSVLHGNFTSRMGTEAMRLESDVWITEVAQTRLALNTALIGPVRIGIAGYLLAPPLIRYDDRTIESLYLQRRNGFEIGIETPLIRRATLEVSSFIEQFSLDRVQGAESIDEIETRRVGVHGRLHYDTLDRAFFPNRGGEASFAYRRRYDDSDRSVNGRVDYSGRRFFPLSDRLNLQIRLEGGSDLNSGLPPYEQYLTGGAELFEGYYYHELSGNHIISAGTDVRFRLLRLPLGVGESIYLRVGGNVGRIWEQGLEQVVDTDTVAGGRIAIAVHTELGELTVGYSINDNARSIVYVLLGPAYTFGGNGYQW